MFTKSDKFWIGVIVSIFLTGVTVALVLEVLAR